MMFVTAAQVLMAGVLDLAIGDPRWLPHPVRAIGRAITGCEGLLRRYSSTAAAERMAGAVLVVIIVAPVYLLAAAGMALLARTDSTTSAALGTAVLVYLIATTIAGRELIGSVKKVVAAIAQRDLDSGRRQVSMIVGRDTNVLTEEGVLKAGIETLAENLSDGIVAPLFYLATGGLPLALAYKAVNTLDSMVGYRNERYLNFGWTAARLDDAANFIPARITGLLIVVSLFLYSVVQRGNKPIDEARRAFTVMLRDGRRHTSPNSGVPEAAMAGAVGVLLGGPSTYGGILSEKPFIGDGESGDYLAASRKALSIAVITSVLAVIMTAGVSFFRSLS